MTTGGRSTYAHLFFRDPADYKRLAVGQTGNGVINGSVKDPTGAVLAGAAVRVTNEGSGVSLDTRTNDAGIYRVSSLGPGRIPPGGDGERLRKKYSARRLTLAVGQVLTLDLYAGRDGSAPRA